VVSSSCSRKIVGLCVKISQKGSPTFLFMETAVIPPSNLYILTSTVEKQPLNNFRSDGETSSDGTKVLGRLVHISQFSDFSHSD
jgi:hypothetical protein